MADLFDSELDAAAELSKSGFTRAAGALAGVVLEKHLAQVCDRHAIKISRKNPGISDFNGALKDRGCRLTYLNGGSSSIWQTFGTCVITVRRWNQRQHK